jgi:hypothetical protein
MKKNRNSLIAFFLGLMSSTYLLFKPKKTSDGMKGMEFSSSTQKMGVRFTDRIRDIFRRRWIKKV